MVKFTVNYVSFCCNLSLYHNDHCLLRPTIHSYDIVLQTEVLDKYSPLILASRFGHADCVTLLLEKGGSVDVKSDRDYNCLMEAIKAGQK